MKQGAFSKRNRMKGCFCHFQLLLPFFHCREMWMESDQCDHVVFNHPLIRQLENGVLRTWVCSAICIVQCRIDSIAVVNRETAMLSSVAMYSVACIQLQRSFQSIYIVTYYINFNSMFAFCLIVVFAWVALNYPELYWLRCFDLE